MPVDDQVDIIELFPDHFTLDLNLIFTVNKSDSEFAERDDLFVRKVQANLGTVHVAGDRLDRRNGPELIKHRHLEDIARMEDEIDALKEFKDRSRQGPRDGGNMGIGDHADSHDARAVLFFSSSSIFRSAISSCSLVCMLRSTAIPLFISCSPMIRVWPAPHF